MSAAGPLPPTANHNSNGARPPNAGVGGEKAYEHIQDLQTRSSQGFNPNAPVTELLNIAIIALQQAKTSVDSRRPDLAYVEYLRAYQIVVEVVPSLRDRTKTGEDHRKYEGLQRLLLDMNDQYDNIKKIIENNNLRSGVRPRNYTAATTHARTRSEAGREDDMRAPPPLSNVNGAGDRLPGSLMPGGHKIKPSVSPKPQALHGHAINRSQQVTSLPSAPNGNDALSDRFAKLRMMPQIIDTQRPDSRASNSSIHSSPIAMPSALDFNGRNSFDALTKSNTISGSKPSGPRGMPNGAPAPSLNTSVAAAMPKAPSPTYSPARNMQTTGNISAPRHSARSLARSEDRRSSLQSVSSASSRAPSGQNERSDYFPTFVPNGAPRRRSTHAEERTRIGAERLYDSVRKYNTLLIDVRPREEYDHGHIYATNVMCVEPMVLRQGMSGDELLESLVLSPDIEYAMLEHRDQYDLVVYYDNDTQSDAFLSRPRSDKEARLKYLHEALYDFNLDKPLRQPPMLLVGGLDAWADLLGSQALVQSNTLAKARSRQGLQRRPVATTNGSSQLRIPKRRLRDFNPLNESEERSWLERARKESVTAVPRITEADEQALEVEGEQQGEEELSTAIREFNERFPDAGNIERQRGFMAEQMPHRQPPPIPPAKIPEYPPPPSLSAYPEVPRRPSPAAPRMSYTGVSDRAVSQTQPAPRTSSQLAPYIPPKYLATNFRLPKTGLVNFGVTCYMNATLQALSATTPLSTFFLDDQYRSLVQRENWKGSKGVLPELYANLIRSLWKGDVESIKPTTFRTFCGRLNREWSIDRQQDAKEFFDFLVDCLHEDLNNMWSRTPLRALTEQEEAKRERMPKMVVAKTEWGRYTHREQSFLTSLFGGQHASRLRCTTCGFTSTTFEAFYSISVEIPRSGRATLDDCLRSYCAEEMMSGEDVWKCPHCKKEREATKQITITRAPQFLVVHFKRFSASHHQSARKVRTVIDFPLCELDLEPYMLPAPTAEQAANITRDYGAQELKTEASMTPPYLYDAYAVERHIGNTLTSGHYTCAVKDRARKTWRMFNDTRITDFQPEQLTRANALQNEEAYIVFYQRSAREDRGGKI